MSDSSRRRPIAAGIGKALAAMLASTACGVPPAGERAGSGPVAPAAAAPATPYRDRLEQIAAASPLATLGSIGHSIEGREIPLLTLAAAGADGEKNPTILIVAGLDGSHLVGVETAIRVAERLVLDHPDLLAGVSVRVLPCGNPDGIARNLGSLRDGHAANLRPVDLDRDGEIGEDPPQDLDGDGAIVQMRQLHPPLGTPATHLADPAAPRLMKTPDRSKGERATYAMWTEGLDSDGDGRIAEDGPGGVRLDRNFPHLHREHQVDAGRHALSEPETRAIAEFVVAHPEIALAVVYGAHDTVMHLPDRTRMDASGRTPLGILEEDLVLHESLAKLFKKSVGETRTPETDAAGSLHAWLYAHRGVPTVATVVWGRPDPPAKDEAAAAGESSSEGEADGAASHATGAPAATAADESAAAADRPTPHDAEAAAWLSISDARGGEGFVEWTPFEHPTLGTVEIGGFVPGFRSMPPAEDLDDIALRHAAFVAELIRRRPMLRIEGPQVKELAPGLYEVRLAIVNEGRLPTMTAMGARARATLPIVLRLSTPTDRIVAGRRIERAWGIAGDGGRFEARWILREPPGAAIEVELVSDHFPDRLLRFAASPDAALEIESLPETRR